MGLIFYHVPMSTSSLTEAVIAELGIAVDVVEMDIDAGDTQAPEFLKINPNGRVPVIVHDGETIWESAAITMYLGETFGVAAGLYPPSGPQRGAAMKWIVWTNTSLAEAAGRLSAMQISGSDGAVQEGSVDFIPAELRNQAALDKAKNDIAAGLNILDAALRDHPYLAGDYTIVDTHVWVLVGWITSMDIDLSPYPDLSDWMQRCADRPALAKLFND